MTSSDYELLRRLVGTRTGVRLEPDADTIAELRLRNLADKEGLAGPGDVLARLRDGAGEPFERRVVEALLNGETSFFRDWAPFEALVSAILPAALRRGPAVVWSAACSTGQEPYSVAMLAREELPGPLRVIASDVSRESLARAREGRYSQLEVNRGLPARLLVKHFEKMGAGWRIHEPLRAAVEFREINLIGTLDVPLCDVILLRNVLIYLPIERRREVLDRVRSRLKPEGVLLLGASETMVGVDDGFDIAPIGSVACYRPRVDRRGGLVKHGDPDLADIVRGIWSVTLNLTPTPGRARPAGPLLASSVRFRGGRLVLRCPAGLARKAAAAMFRSAKVSDVEIRDALGELANMTAGNLGSGVLSLPEAGEPGGVESRRMSFDCDGETFEIGVIEDKA